MKFLRWLNYSLYKFQKIAVVTIFLGLLGLSSVQVILRLFFHGGIQNAETLSRYLVLWVAFLGAALATFKKRHINLELVSKVIKTKNQAVVKLTVSLVSFVIAGLLVYSGVIFIINEFSDSAAPVFFIPVWVLESILPLTFFSMSLIFLRDTVDAIGAMTKKAKIK